MMDAIKQFFFMHGHGTYVFSAYGIACALLIWQWLPSWRRFRHYLITKNNK